MISSCETPMSLSMSSGDRSRSSATARIAFRLARRRNQPGMEATMSESVNIEMIIPMSFEREL